MKTQAIKYRKKPISIRAFQFTEDLALAVVIDGEKLPFGLRITSAGYHPQRRQLDHAYITIKTLEGDMKAYIGDWIIRGVKGEVYPCKEDIFKKTYEKIT